MAPDQNFPRYIGCHDCDALFIAPEALQEGERIVCPRCGAQPPTRVRRNAVQRATAFALACGGVLRRGRQYRFPFLSLKADYRESDMVLAQSVTGLESAGYPPLATAVAIFTLRGTHAGHRWPALPVAAAAGGAGGCRARCMLCRAVLEARRWNMVEVYLLGVLVSLLKLGSLATLTLGTSFWAFVGLIICLTAALACIDHRELWTRLDMACAEAETAVH